MLVFVPLLTSSILTKIVITSTHVLQEEKIVPVIPRSWSWDMRYNAYWLAPFSGEPIVPAIHGRPFLISDVITIYLCFDWKNSEKNFPQLHLATLRVIRISRLDDAFSEIAETRKLPQKDRCRKRNGKKKKIMIKEKKRELNPWKA